MYKFEISNIIYQPNDTVTLVFKDLSGNYPKAKAGQFLTVSFTFGEREVRRSYSFSSSPDVNEPLAITGKRDRKSVVEGNMGDDGGHRTTRNGNKTRNQSG